eukprot:2228644-Ditylum_brightwellii.AAC.1
MDNAMLKIYLSKEIDLYLKRQDQYKENKMKMFNVIIGQCTDLMITKLENMNPNATPTSGAQLHEELLHHVPTRQRIAQEVPGVLC